MDPLRIWNLAKMADSPAHYLASLSEGDEPTAAMERGSATHSLVLGGPKVIAYQGAVRRGKEWEAFEARHPDKLILTAKDYDIARRMADAVRAHPEAMRVLTGTCEKTLFWEMQGRKCRATPDCVGDGFVTELKTARTSDPVRFAWQAAKMGYLAQCSWYETAIEMVHGKRPKDFYIVAVESSEPYPVTVLQLTPRARLQGEKMWRGWFERLRACEESGHFPAYCEAIVPLDVPDDDELELTFGEAA